ncbi:DUF3885 domain-containing protein [Paenibacillus nicotianae]
MNHDFNQWLEQTFPQMKLEVPLFYNFPLGLRFELGVPYRGIDDPTYFEQLEQRAISLFEAVFAESEQVCVMTFTYQTALSDIKHIYRNEVQVLENYLQLECLPQVILHSERPDYDEDTAELMGYIQSRYVWCTLGDLDYGGILKAIGYTDFPEREASLVERVFFIEPKQQIIFHMYDDRGLDIVGMQQESLQRLYHQYYDWLLPYDMEKMNQVFGI